MSSVKLPLKVKHQRWPLPWVEFWKKQKVVCDIRNADDARNFPTPPQWTGRDA